MEIEISDYEGRTYSSIRIPSLRFVGLLNHSEDKRFGIAAGVIVQTQERVVLYLCDGAITWRADDCAPMDIRFSVNGWGGFVTSTSICAFNPDGIVFDVGCPFGIGKVCTVRHDDNQVIFLSDRYEIVYDLTGHLLRKERL